jgi:predicted dithiol-disulfide oxidoreductase (DUF899 family)
MPNESAAYRAARNELLDAERNLRHQVEAVAVLRRKLPLGGEVNEDYEFDSNAGPVKLSELFGPHETLVLYSYMFGPRMKSPCVMCTAFVDSIEGAAPHLMQHVTLAIIAKSPLERLETFAKSRGWENLRLLSAAKNSYNRDYFAETDGGDQSPALNVFVKRDGRVYHFWQSELMHIAPEPGQHPRHIDMIWPLWNVLDLTPQGRGTNWFPKLSY